MNTTTFGAWLKQQLKRREWRQADFARRLGVSTGTVSKWIRDKRVPDPASCERIADALHQSHDVVLAMAGHRTDLCDQDTPDQAAMISLIRSIHWTADRIDTARSMLEAMARSDQRRQQGR